MAYVAVEEEEDVLTVTTDAAAAPPVVFDLTAVVTVMAEMT